LLSGNGNPATGVFIDNPETGTITAVSGPASKMVVMTALVGVVDGL
jgi:hypothetical protein